MSLGQMHRKLPSKFSHRASPHSARVISHSFTSEKDGRGGREVSEVSGTYAQACAPEEVGARSHEKSLYHLVIGGMIHIQFT